MDVMKLKKGISVQEGRLKCSRPDYRVEFCESQVPLVSLGLIMDLMPLRSLEREMPTDDLPSEEILGTKSRHSLHFLPRCRYQHAKYHVSYTPNTYKT